MHQILIVEDNDEISIILKKRLTLGNYEVKVLTNGLDLISKMREKDFNVPDAVVLDLMIPGRSGYDLLNTIHSVWPNTKLFVFSSHDEYRKKIPSDFIEGFFLKTDGTENLIEAINRSLK